MKTISVIFTKDKVTNEVADKMKSYTFNTESDVKVGDLVTIEGYNSNLQVTKVYDMLYKNYYPANGSLFVDNDTLPEIKEVSCGLVKV